MKEACNSLRHIHGSQETTPLTPDFKHESPKIIFDGTREDTEEAREDVLPRGGHLFTMEGNDFNKSNRLVDNCSLVHTNSRHLLVNLQGQDEWTGVVSGSVLLQPHQGTAVAVKILSSHPLQNQNEENVHQREKSSQ